MNQFYLKNPVIEEEILITERLSCTYIFTFLKAPAEAEVCTNYAQ